MMSRWGLEGMQSFEQKRLADKEALLLKSESTDAVQSQI